VKTCLNCKLRNKCEDYRQISLLNYRLKKIKIKIYRGTATLCENYQEEQSDEKAKEP